jgi:archaellum biogenesis ATPase FlaH
MTKSRSESVAQTERALLGSILLVNTLWPKVAVLSVEDFCLDSHRRIFRQMAAMFEDRLPVDLVTLTDRLVRLHQIESCGDATYIASLIELTVPENVSAYVRSIRTAAVERRVAQQIELLASTSELGLLDRSASLRAQCQRLIDSLDAVQFDDSCIHATTDVLNIFSIEVPDVDFIVRDILPRGNVVLVTGDPGCGKSFFMLRMGVSIAMGTEFLGCACEATPVLIIDKENPIQLQRQRLRILAGGPVPGLKIWGGWLPDPPPMLDDARLLRIARQERPVIVFDSLVRFHDVDENSASEMRHVMAHVRRLAVAGATVILLHHKPKSDESLYRGSSDILAAVDMAFILEMEKPGRLRFRCFKSRLSEERTFTIRANFAEGQFEMTDSTPVIQYRNAVEILQSIIANSPGSTTSQITAQAGIRKCRVVEVLQANEGIYWRTERGQKNATLYFPIRCVPAPVPDDGTGNRSQEKFRNRSATCSHSTEHVGTAPVVPRISTPTGGMREQVTPNAPAA